MKTKEEAKYFIFPYNNNEFDLVFLFSVFTHMLPQDVDNYISQISRVLKQGGICYATFFIIHEENNIPAYGTESFKFKFDKGDHVLFDNNVKEANVAYKELPLKQMLERNQFVIEKFHYGYWSGKDKNQCLNFQDIVILRKV